MPGTDRVRRILMTADAVGGVWTYAMELARGLAAYDIEIALATMGNAVSADRARQAAAQSNLTLHESTYRLEWMSDPWHDVERAGDWLLTLESDLQPDVIHLNGYAHGSLPWSAPCVVVGHSCVLSWWRAVKETHAPEEWTQYRFAVTRGIRAADLVIAPSRAMLGELQRYYGPLQATIAIPNGRSSHVHRPGRKEPFILAAGRLWDEAKNIAALAKVRRGVEWPIVVAGDSAHPEGVSPDFGNLRLLGTLSGPELADWYSRAPIYCLPAKYEPFGLTVLEAALSGCALVLGNIPSLRENWDGAAVFVPPSDVAALEYSLRDLIAHAGYRSVMAERALARARSFGVERMAESYVAAYPAGRRLAQCAS